MQYYRQTMFDQLSIVRKVANMLPFQLLSEQYAMFVCFIIICDNNLNILSYMLKLGVP